MNSYNKFIGNFLELPESERRKFVELVQRLSGVGACNEESLANDASESNLPSVSRDSLVSSLSDSEQIENEKKSPMKQNTLDKWLLKSKSASKDDSDTTKAPGEGQRFSNQSNGLDSTLTDINESSNQTAAIKVTSVARKNDSQSDQFLPSIVLSRVNVNNFKIKSRIAETENLKIPILGSSTENCQLTEGTDGVSNVTNAILVNESDQACSLNHIPVENGYSSRLRCRSKKSQIQSSENISKNLKTSSTTVKFSHPSDFDETIESVVKNSTSSANSEISENNRVKKVSFENSQKERSPRKHTHPKMKKSQKSDVISVPDARRNNIDETSAKVNVSKKSPTASKSQLNVTSCSENKLSLISKKSDTKASLLAVKEKSPSSPCVIKKVVDKSSDEKKGTSKNKDNGSRRSKRTLFPKKADELLNNEPTSTSDEVVKMQLISNTKSDGAKEFVFDKVSSTVNECVKNQSSGKSETSVSCNKRKRSLDSSKDVSTSEKLEPCVKKSRSTSQQSSKQKLTKDSMIFSSGSQAQQKSSEKLSSPETKTAPKSITGTKSKNQEKYSQISENNSVFESCYMKDVCDTNSKKNVKSTTVSNEEDESISSTLNNQDNSPFKDKNSSLLKEKKDATSKSNTSKKVVKKGKKTRNVKQLSKTSKNIEITVSSGTKKKISFSDSTLKFGQSNANELNQPKRKSFLKFAVSNPELQSADPIHPENCVDPVPPNVDNCVSIDSSCESDSPNATNEGSELTFYSDFKNLVVTIRANEPDSEDSGLVLRPRASKRKISIKPNSPNKKILEIANQETPDAASMNELLEMQFSSKDPSLISPIKMKNSTVNRTISTRAARKGKKDLNSIIESLKAIPVEKSQDAPSQNFISDEEQPSGISSTQMEESFNYPAVTLNNILDCSIGMTSTLGLSQKQLDYEANNEVNRLCCSIGLNSDQLFQTAEIVDGIQTASCEDVFIIRGHRLPSGVIVPSICKTVDFKGILTNTEISKIVL